ncbi:MAG: hypothetical protein ACRD2P_06460 [Terriglobia bacterium]
MLGELLGNVRYIVTRIVYFIGAGLTKSLERPVYRLPLMFDFVSVMTEHFDDDVIVSALVNLELAEVYDWPSPEATWTAKVLEAEGRNFSPPNREAFKRALKARPSESIEKVLKNARASSADGLAQRFKSAINQLFATVGWNVNLAPLERFLEKQIGLNHSNHTLIDFNYDLLLERAAEKIPAAGWNVQTGYDIRVEPYVPDGASKSTALDDSALPGAIRVLKPHGSLNWRVPIVLPVKAGALGYEFENGPIVIPLTQNGELSRAFHKCTNVLFIAN